MVCYNCTKTEKQDAYRINQLFHLSPTFHLVVMFKQLLIGRHNEKWDKDEATESYSIKMTSI